MGWYREKEWELIVANRKACNAMSVLDDDFDCLECDATITYSDYIYGDGEYCCPFCGEEILPQR